ncbi:MAG: AAA family ATPase [Saprospiraceae bacterium]|nr:AAA family ATPase [Saprospiraceae bacterium]
MLLRFVVSNFLSFAEEVEFNMFPGNFKIHKDHVYHTPEVDLLKTAAIYGANGSGKSNFVKAIATLQEIVQKGQVENLVGKDFHFKLDAAYSHKPTSFEVEIKKGKMYFAYGLDLLAGGIQNEWLYQIFPASGKQEIIFDRTVERSTGKTSIEANKKYLKNEKEKLRYEIYSEEIKASEVLLKRVTNRMKEADMVVEWLLNDLWIIGADEEFGIDVELLMSGDTHFTEYLNKIIGEMDTGMVKLELQRIGFNHFFGEDDEYRARVETELDENETNAVSFFDRDRQQTFVARRENGTKWIEKLATYNIGQDEQVISLDKNEQSDGTRRLLELAPILYELQNSETVFIVDEIERSLHPSVIKSYIDLIMTKKTKGQLVFTTHESNLLDLDLFRQDEVWLVEKNKKGASKMYSLSEFKPRYDLDIRKGYLAGRFGAIPFLGNLKELNWHHAEEQGI